jgi:hypothetical protein
MEFLIRWSSWIYGCLLIAYPRELRRRFGADVIEVFEEQLCEAAMQCGRSGIVSLWCTALWELASVAASRLESTTVIAGPCRFWFRRQSPGYFFDPSDNRFQISIVKGGCTMRGQIPVALFGILFGRSGHCCWTPRSHQTLSDMAVDCHGDRLSAFHALLLAQVWKNDATVKT